MASHEWQSDDWDSSRKSSAWPSYGDTFTGSEAFANSASGFREYLSGADPSSLALPREQVLDLFSTDLEPNAIYDEIGKFLQGVFSGLGAPRGKGARIIVYDARARRLLRA